MMGGHYLIKKIKETEGFTSNLNYTRLTLAAEINYQEILARCRVGVHWLLRTGSLEHETKPVESEPLRGHSEIFFQSFNTSSKHSNPPRPPLTHNYYNLEISHTKRPSFALL